MCVSYVYFLQTEGVLVSLLGGEKQPTPLAHVGGKRAAESMGVKRVDDGNEMGSPQPDSGHRVFPQQRNWEGVFSHSTERRLRSKLRSRFRSRFRSKFRRRLEIQQSLEDICGVGLF